MLVCHLKRRHDLQLCASNCVKASDGVAHEESKGPAGRTRGSCGGETLEMGDFWPMRRASLLWEGRSHNGTLLLSQNLRIFVLVTCFICEETAPYWVVLGDTPGSKG